MENASELTAGQSEDADFQVQGHHWKSFNKSVPAFDLCTEVVQEDNYSRFI